ncbi:serine/threonine-protein kinase [Bacillus oleivorans]|uniref:Serine/threonine-protein kinase n=1 Tax=Bacillus oleivorans TaxID=1448271 RepID=A0A285D5D7_9BACI|nr:protein kinase [Bacillus oleivorans]SNX74383.1 serine/threonine-protein kinase [Bacillus oleivorans]
MRSIRKLYQFFVDIPNETGSTLNDRYEVLRVLGTGSYGIVYLCKDLKTLENKIIKQLRPSKRNKRRELALFENEIKVLRSLNHLHVPSVYETFSSNGNYFYVMSFIEGDNLEDLIFEKKKTFKEKESLLILTELLEIVNELHFNSIYHQDLRIPNIIMQNNHPYLIDFGLSKQVLNESNQQKMQELKQQDYYDLGEILLFMLYTTYSSEKKKALPWTEELSLEKETVFLLKRLLGIKDPYLNSCEILADLQDALKAM